ncbi:MAG TPA: DUF4440 domain-containing protein [Desulfosporosinus sp.]|jgi:hypothetical protein|nr:DUF4440 domain-containing protein [Desulfosporosinus sp.]
MDFSHKEQLCQLELRLLQPEVRRSAEDIAWLLGDNFVEFGSSGRIFCKQQVVEGLPQEPSVRMILQDFHATTLAPDVVLTNFRVVKHRDPGAENVHSLRSSIWKFIDGRWQMIFHQGTPTTDIY